MGATVIVYWPDITEEQIDSQPDFYNDSKAWGDWMAERESEPAVTDALRKLNAEAILTQTTDGVRDEDVMWVTPAQLRDAATRLREAVRGGSTETRIILETYARNAGSEEEVAEDFVRDLEDIIEMAGWAEKEGASKITLEVNW
jgi:hypothetical protein